MTKVQKLSTFTMKLASKLIPILLIASLAPFAHSGPHATVTTDFSLWHRARVSPISEPSTKPAAFQLPCQ